MKNKACNRTCKTWLILGLLVPGTTPLVAQDSELSGKVVSGASGSPVAGARVAVRQAGGGASQETTTDADGVYGLPNLPPGRYTVQVAAAGFQGRETVLDLSRPRTDYQVALEVFTLETEITVTSSLPEFVSELRLGSRELEERGSDDLAEAMRYESGLTSIRRGPINLEPTIRGLQETQVAMFVDGTRTFAAGPARMDSDLSHISPHVVQSVRVVKGPYALTWGAGTLSAIDVDTFRPPFASSEQFELGGAVNLRAGDSDDSRDGYARLWGSGERLRFSLFHNDRSGGDYEAAGGRVVPADFDSANTRLSLGFRLTPQSLLEYSGGYQEQNDLDYPGRILDATYFYTRSHSLDYTWSGTGDVVSEITAQLFVNRKDHRMNNDEKPTAQPAASRIPPFGIRVDLPTESNTQGGRLGVGWVEGNWRFKVGGDFYQSEQTARRSIFRRSNGLLLFQDIVWPDAGIDDYGAYFQAIYGRGGTQLGGTLRVDRVETATGEISDFFLSQTLGPLDPSETNLSVAVNGQFRLNGRWVLLAGVGSTRRTATTLERYSDRFPATKFQLSAEFLGNPQLDPEESLELNLGNQVALGAGVHLEIDAFYRQIDDYITVLPDPAVPRRLPLSPPVVYRYINGTEATFWGGELRLDQGVGRHFRWRIGLNYVRGEDELLGEPVLGIPPFQAQLGLRLQSQKRRFWGDLTVTAVDRQDRVAVSRFERQTPGYVLFDLRAGVRLISSLELKGGLENLTDKEYSYHLNAPNPFGGGRILEVGRNLFLELGYRF